MSRKRPALHGRPGRSQKGPKSPGGGGGVLPYKRLLGMCRWMG